MPTSLSLGYNDVVILQTLLQWQVAHWHEWVIFRMKNQSRHLDVLDEVLGAACFVVVLECLVFPLELAGVDLVHFPPRCHVGELFPV